MSQNLIFGRVATQSTFSSNMSFVESQIATCPSHRHNKKTGLFLGVAYWKANIVMSFMESGYTREENMDNRQHFVLDTTDLPGENLAIANLMSA